MSELTIRRVRADEWRRWRDVRLRMLRDDAAYFSSRYEDAVREPDETWQRWVADSEPGGSKALFCAEEDDAWLGTVGGFIRVDPAEAQLISMWVDPAARGRGVAQALIRAMVAWAAEQGCERVFLFVQEANAGARRLYTRAGFEPTGARAPIGGGRSGFKLVLSASVYDLLA